MLIAYDLALDKPLSELTNRELLNAIKVCRKFEKLLSEDAYETFVLCKKELHSRNLKAFKRAIAAIAH